MIYVMRDSSTADDYWTGSFCISFCYFVSWTNSLVLIMIYQQVFLWINLLKLLDCFVLHSILLLSLIHICCISRKLYHSKAKNSITSSFFIPFCYFIHAQPCLNLKFNFQQKISSSTFLTNCLILLCSTMVLSLVCLWHNFYSFCIKFENNCLTG